MQAANAQHEEREHWQSRIGFIAAAAGSAIGLGNIWRFPYLVGENGGAAFVLIYLACIAVIGLPVMLAELSIGRAAGKNPFGAFLRLAPMSQWKHLGSLGIVTGLGILSFYCVIAGWTIGYLYLAILGRFSGPVGKADMEALFAGLTADPGFSIGLMLLFLGLTAWVVLKGVQGGIERWSKTLMPALLLLLLFLVGRSLTLPGAFDGLEYYLKPDFSRVTAGTLVNAMGQALFSLSLGMGTMITYGSYLQKKENMVHSALWVVGADTGIAIVAGFVIFPALFAMGVDPAAGPGLVFIVFPSIFGQMPGGYFFGIAFFALLTLAALTSSISLMEVVVAYVVEEWGWTRKKAAGAVLVVCGLLAIPSALAFGASGFLSALPGLGMDFLSLMDIVFGNFALAVGALLIAVFTGYVWGVKPAAAELTHGNPGFRGRKPWTAMILVGAPVAIAVILVNLIRSTFF